MPRLTDILSQREIWLTRAEALRPRLISRDVPAATAVIPTWDVAAFQSWRMQPLPGSALPRALVSGTDLYLDLGEHAVGHLEVRLQAAGPVTIRCQLGELPAETAESFDPFTGSIPRSWLQDPLLEHPGDGSAVILPRRVTMRFARLCLVTGPSCVVQAVTMHAVSSAPPIATIEPPPGADALIDRIALRTLHNCMQDIFEDGPKRDHRLWLGDLRLQAQADAVTFATPRLVERCLFLLAGCARTRDGAIPACVFLDPAPHHDHEFILDYLVLFAACLRDLLASGGNRAVAMELADLAFHQVRLALAYRGEDGAFLDPGEWWIFIDWRDGLDKQAAMHGVLAFACHAAAALAMQLDRVAEHAEFSAAYDQLRAAARRVFAPRTGACWISGPQHQVSWATHAWLTLSGCLTTGEARAAFAELALRADAVRPATPYLVHHVIEALRSCGATAQAAAEIERVWGGMARLGASTFWEAFDPTNHQLSPYGNHHLNSACHAWSCGPAWFSRHAPDAVPLRD